MALLNSAVGWVGLRCVTFVLPDHTQFNYFLDRITHLLTKTYAFCTLKNRINEILLLSTYNIYVKTDV